MFRKIFKKKRKLPLHELAMEYSFLQYRKNLFLRRYITIMVCGTFFMFWMNGKFNHNTHWTYYFALNNDSQIVKINSNSIPQPFSRREILSYSKQVAYRLFSITPQTQKSHLNALFGNDILYKGFVDSTHNALLQSKLIQRLKSGWHYSLESLGTPKVNKGTITVNGEKLNGWQVLYHDFVLYGRKC
jgi:hypothetical protein